MTYIHIIGKIAGGSASLNLTVGCCLCTSATVQQDPVPETSHNAARLTKYSKGNTELVTEGHSVPESYDLVKSPVPLAV